MTKQTDVISDPLHEHSPEDVRWTTRNFAEAMPGVPTPASWSYWSPAVNASTFDNFQRMGLYSARQCRLMERTGPPLMAIFFGHAAANLDLLTGALAHVPGFDPAAFERDFFGVAPSARTPKPTLSRLPVVLPKMIAAVARHPKRLQGLAAETDIRWRRIVGSPANADQLRAVLSDAVAHFTHAQAVHTFQTQAAQRAYGSVAALAERHGKSGTEISIVSGSGVLEELAVARDLWRLSRDEVTVSDFLLRHGYHGPDEGELSARSWREDPAPVLAAAQGLKAKPDSDSPDGHLRRQQADRDQAEEALLAAVPPARRVRARATIRAARKQVPLREVGKAAFLKEIDIARFALRGLGDVLQQGGAVENSSDVFYLTIPEAIGARPSDDLHAMVTARKARRAEYSTMEVPGYWTGNPEPLATDTTAPVTTGVVSGLPACPGVTEGVARVVLDPGKQSEPLRPDEILIAHTTDPGWVSLFMDAGGIAVDIGGTLSHAAIVARELGIPCVINTLDGTRRIPDGARVRIDGGRGTIEILG